MTLFNLTTPYWPTFKVGAAAAGLSKCESGGEGDTVQTTTGQKESPEREQSHRHLLLTLRGQDSGVQLSWVRSTCHELEIKLSVRLSPCLQILEENLPASSFLLLGRIQILGGCRTEVHVPPASYHLWALPQLPGPCILTTFFHSQVSESMSNPSCA